MKLAFLGGYHAFPGGQFDSADAEAPVENCADAETATAISCAARELFEETEVLLARGGDALTQGQRASLLDDLQSGRMSLARAAETLRSSSRCRRFHFRRTLGNAAV